MIKFLVICTKVLFVTVYLILRFTFLIPMMITELCSAIFFNKRCDWTKKRLYVENFEGFKEEKVYFMSGKNKLCGGFYTSEKGIDNGCLLIFAHGIGCGKNNYYNRINYFARKGYTVFAYDVTGCCESEGKGIIGIPQAVIDLDKAINYVLQSMHKDKKIVLYGHSWGGYAVASILNGDKKDKISAVATMSGFDEPIEILFYQSRTYAGSTMRLAKNHINFASWYKFGRVAKYKSMEGINNFGKPVFIGHSDNDTTVSLGISILNSKTRCTNPHAEFHLYSGKGHTLSRPYDRNARVEESKKLPLPKIKQGRKESAFKFNFDCCYHNADIADIYAIDEEFMETIDKFYQKAVK